MRIEVRYFNSAQIVPGIFEQPSRNIRIVNHQQKIAGEYHLPRHRPETPVPLNGQLTHRPRHSLSGGSPYREFRSQHRKTQQRKKQQIYQDERRPAVFSDYKRETPYISQSYGAPCRQHEKAESRTQFSPFFFAFHALITHSDKAKPQEQIAKSA